MDFLNKVEVIKQYRQSVRNREKFDFFKSVIQKFLELKVRTMSIVYEKETRNLVWMQIFCQNSFQGTLSSLFK